jgi:hypothetical protein
LQQETGLIIRGHWHEVSEAGIWSNKRGRIQMRKLGDNSTYTVWSKQNKSINMNINGYTTYKQWKKLEYLSIYYRTKEDSEISQEVL